VAPLPTLVLCCGMLLLLLLLCGTDEGAAL
jgi:hypothetical protein